jgi:3-phosphoshikimate 1-carboxyvinyltransferase
MSDRALRGRVRVPGDKSISHRALILAALASGRSAIHGLNLGADVRATARIVEALGPAVRMDGALVEVESLGRRRLREPEIVLDAGNSGTTLRMVLGVCAGIEGFSLLTGDASLRRRPMLRVVSPLRMMGARIDGRAGGDLAPLAVRGGGLTAIDFDSTIASAQVKTCVLLAGLFAEGRTSVTEPSLSRDHTERMLESGGAAVRRQGLTVAVDGGADIGPMEWHVPGDPSAAMFLAVAAALVPGSDIVVEGLDLNPTRTGGIDVLRRMGAHVEMEATGEVNGEPIGDLRVRASELRAITVGRDEVVACIDEIPALAVAAARAHGETVVTGASELRVKESDRISALVEGLRVLGVDAAELPDGFVVRGPAELGGGTVESLGDHRIAMAFAVAGLVAREVVTVLDRGCVETSFPGFDEVLASARGGR